MGRISERQRIELALIWACTLILLYVLVLAPHIAAQRRTRSRRRLRQRSHAWSTISAC